MFEKHLTYSEMMLGIKSGKYFYGRLMLSRIEPDEGSVACGNLQAPLLISGQKDLNRAINADMVCLEVNPADNWQADPLFNQKVIDAAHLLQGQIGEQEEVEHEDKFKLDSEDEEEVGEARQLIQKINQATEKEGLKVTARVLGAIKTLNKTYGGSIIAN
jgi:exosome complex exonuclease DIS3/RRP44